MIDHVSKSYLNKKNCWNEESFQNLESVIKVRYFKLQFIGLHSKLTQNKVDQHWKRFCENKTWFLQVKNYDVPFEKRSISK